MVAILAKFLTPLVPYLVAAFLALAGLAVIAHLRHELAAASLTTAMLQQTNQANIAEIAAYQAQALKWNTALDTLGVQTQASDHALHIITDHIAAQHPGMDAPVAPILAQTLADIGKLQENQQ
ncbi:MAG: hypothetical protein POG74_05640 [Acidocella sp.]|nr:hypothetical protein [Acidocella sp.]